jgi:oligopeptide/dipeptide ABC transporter ATP-binding protein
MTVPALKVSGLNVWLGNGDDSIHIVDSVSFSIDPGEATGLVGESGCGKTMTAMAIMGLLPSTGVRVSCDHIEISGRDISGFNTVQRRNILGRDIAMIFQQPSTALDPVFSIGQQISAVYRRHAKADRHQVREAMLAALESVGFQRPEDIAKAYPHQLSGGMRQLSMIAMAMVCKPAIIIADEPTTALDSSTRTLILQQLQQLQALHGTAMLFISHDLGVVRHSCRNVMVMYCGRLIEKTDCQSLFSHARHPYSAGLLSCIPQLGATRPGRIRSIPGQVPAPADLPSGCHFAARCDRYEPRCSASTPALDARDKAGVACFRPL